MKKNLKSCLTQQYFEEPECLLDMNDYEMITANGLIPDLRRKKSAHMTAGWSFAKTTEAYIGMEKADMSQYRYLTFSVYAIEGQGGSFRLFFESGSQESGESGYGCVLPIGRNGWNDYRIELPFLQAFGNAEGWEYIRGIRLDAAWGGQANRTETVLCLDSFYVWAEEAPQLYVRMPELKGAALFSKCGAYAIVNRRRLPIAVDADPDARPFETNGVLWLPMAPVAAVMAYKAVADNRAYTLSFTYRRRKYVFYGNSDRYLENGEEKTLEFRPMVRAGTLFFPADYLREFFRWRQCFVDAGGVILLSNRRGAFESGRDDELLWQLNAEMTFVCPTGEEILADLHRRVTNPAKGRLLLSPEEWMEKRKQAKAEGESRELLKALRATYGSTSEEYRAQPVFATQSEELSFAETISRASDRICGFAALYRMTGDKKFAERAAAEQEAMANLADWDAEHSMLTAARAGLAMSLGYDWCHAIWSEARKALIERAILRYTMRPGVECYRGKAKMWRNGSAEAAEINCGLTAAALALSDVYPETALRILRNSLRNAADCMKAYAPDGGYAESLAAWERGTRATVLLIAMLQSACGRDYGLASAPGFAATAMFPIMAETANGAWNYHGCPAGRVDTAVFGWFARQYDRPVYAWLRKNAILTGKKPVSVLDFVFSDVTEETEIPELPLDAVYRRAGLAMLRSGWGEEDAFFGLHGGSNHVSGGELDAGSILLEMGGERFLCETGGETALPAIERMAARGQNTLTVDPPADPAVPDQNPDAVCEITEARSTAEHAYAVVDLTATNDAIVKAKRGILLTEGRTLAVVQDELTLRESGEVVWTVHTKASVQKRNNRTLILEQNGKQLLCKLCGAGTAPFAVTPIEGTELTRITVRVAVKEKLRMAVAFKLIAEGGELPEKLYEWKPITQWIV